MNTSMNLSYVGNVNIKLNIHGKIVNVYSHNTGLPDLQKAFCKYITATYDAMDDVPRFIDLRESISNSSYNSILLNKLPLTGKSFAEGKYSATSESTPVDTWIAKLTAVLSSNSMSKSVEANSTANYRLYLISEANNGHENLDLAYIEVPAQTLSMVGPGVQAIIEWSMQLLVDSPETA